LTTLNVAVMLSCLRRGGSGRTPVSWTDQVR